VCSSYTELFRGTDNISDREARNVTISNLKVMIKAWLDENYPDMPNVDRERMAERMDMSLIDSKKAVSVNSIYELNHVIRMSFIEAQFIKKVSKCVAVFREQRHPGFVHVAASIQLLTVCACWDLFRK
jgi:hypothetical protein